MLEIPLSAPARGLHTDRKGTLEAIDGPEGRKMLAPACAAILGAAQAPLPRFPVDLGPNEDGIDLPFDSDAKEVIAFDFATVREGHS